MHQFSPEDLLEFFYGDATTERHEAIARALQTSWPLRQKMAVIAKAAEQLDKSLHQAPNDTVSHVLAYASQRHHTLID
jgi:hypothetical protein